MSSPIISVTEGRMTVTANDTEENIREAAGFPEQAEPDSPEKPEPEKAAATEKADDRNPDGTFKAKTEKPAEEPAKPEKAEDGDPRKSYQAKINLLTAKQRDAERRAEEAERRAAEREAELQALRQPRQPEPVQAPPSASAKYIELVKRYQAEPDAPKYDDFVAAGLEDPYTAHRDAMSIYTAQRYYADQQAQQAERAQQQDMQTRAATAFSTAVERHPDFSELLETSTVAYSPAVQERLMMKAAHDPDLSADLMYHLLTHPDDATRLARHTDPIAAAEEIGRLTALVSASSGPEHVATQTTTAKPLIKPVRTSVMAPESSPPEELPFGPKYIAAMNDKERKAREARRA